MSRARHRHQGRVFRRPIRGVILALWLGTFLGCAGEAPSDFDAVDTRTEWDTSWLKRPPVLIEGTCTRFRWTFRYAGPDGELRTDDDLHSVDELHAPTDVPVELRLTSTDYLYVFEIDRLQISEMAIPEMIHTLRFRVHGTGRYDLVADPLCGVPVLHDDIVGAVIFRPVGDADHWDRHLHPAPPVSPRAETRSAERIDETAAARCVGSTYLHVSC